MVADAITSPVAIVVLGHINSGKSTLVGQLLVQCGMISEAQLATTAKLAVSGGRPTKAFAWLTDRTVDERARGFTINFSVHELSSSRGALTLVNTPGHPKHFKHTVWATSTADCALIVVSAPDDQFDSEFNPQYSGLTQEVCKLAFSQGIRQLVIAVNKMDDLTVDYDEAKFRNVCAIMLRYVRLVGFKDENVTFVPTAAWSGDNLTDPTTSMPWYTGPTLLDALHNLEPPRRVADKPLRMPIQVMYRVPGVGLVAFGRVETGEVRRGMSVAVGPGMQRVTVASIQHHRRDVVAAGPGCHVGVCIKDASDNKFKRGMVISDARCDPGVAALSITAQLALLSARAASIQLGSKLIVNCHTMRIPCIVTEIKFKLDRQTGEMLQTDSDELVADDAGVVVLEPQVPAVIESLREFPSLSRLVVCDRLRVVAVGVVRSVKKAQRPSAE
ncbi:hypothetical protein P43SY_006672 [Pythium insidiosum]|uniref:Tr-type G domain-containing protein n=1 Tax=Pythium insidiosum TaxID=114742 RepID=A0AAD5M2C8_PYTIN|nr:hypothetical protein P43SY_006672 [Pythium insidiosum]